MDLVVDANILFAAMIKEGYTSKQLFRDDLHLYAPEFLFAEFEKYRDILLMKASRNEDEFEELLRILERRIVTIPHEEIESFLEEAINISPDEKDYAKSVPSVSYGLRFCEHCQAANLDISRFAPLTICSVHCSGYPTSYTDLVQ